ncbi:SAM-dependent methyltransferase [Salipaludibacillus keqinensis]|uniref:Uncharacterized methyltransferase CR194_14025 n=1 Tax=Salipaludibacillus keqinensis TaxID=2045207 RepID=A0A323TDN0_9BACI|nr:class I SAM-dependent methyltransferase [Salipaludibacillus keqinensis]PYZ92766.1 SAM-dependent methyltransferase [Salipaludibacillus keqinensis]
MGTEFIDLFDQWADSYDATVEGQNDEYREVFRNYSDILKSVADKVSGKVIEFGSGTGNLTALLLARTTDVTGVEPSREMRRQAAKKWPEAKIVAGDFFQFPDDRESIDAFVSSYAFHHLTDDEKRKAVQLYASLLEKDGKVVFADTMFVDEHHHQQMIRKAEENHYVHLAEDLQTEYYTTIPKLKRMFENEGFEVNFSSLNQYVWILEAIKL